MSSTPTSAPPTTSPSPPPWPASRWSSWSCTCWPPAGPGPWSASDAPVPDLPAHPAAGHGRGPGLRLRAAAGGGDQLLQLGPRGRLAPRRLHRRLVGPGLGQPRRPSRPLDLGQGRRRRHPGRPGPRNLSVLRRPAPPLLRPGDPVPAGGPADRPPRDRHRHRPAVRLPVPRGPAVAVDDRRRPRHLLHRGGVQQRPRPPPPYVGVPRGSLHGPRRRRRPDLPPGHLPHPPLGPPGRRPARLRPLLRREI